ncbi:MAG TPA: ABC transporter permease [Xanthobacteraceae bacterium]|jgi:NitT/TauT family transport system permease protein|nr:ABC transporter permease [Xanthobacteraceae bacterium]
MTLTHRLLVILGRLAVLAVILLGAEIGVRSGVLSELFFSSPSLIFKALLTQWQNGSFLQDAGITVLETLLGLVSGSLLGMAVGLLLPQLRLVSHVFEPFLMVLNGIPVIVIAPLFILWLGLGILSKIGISIYIVFFAMFIPVYTASLRLDTTFVDALHVMGASRSQIFWKVIVPSSLPSVYTGLKIGSGLALIGAVIGEFVASRSGLGHMILYASGTLDTPTLYLGIITLAVFAAALSFAIDALGPVLVHYRFSDEK